VIEYTDEDGDQLSIHASTDEERYPSIIMRIIETGSGVATAVRVPVAWIPAITAAMVAAADQSERNLQ
jgi:hypothetical protein